MSFLAQGHSTQPFHEGGRSADELIARYQAIMGCDRLTWLTQRRKLRLLGTGGQGVVYLSERHGSDQFSLPVALKVFSPQHYHGVEDYEADMSRVARTAARVALIQQDNVLDVHDFIEEDGIRVMEMEWVDGHDLGHLLTPHLLDQARQRARPDHWQYINDVIVTAGPQQPRLKPGIAIQVLRECLAALAALHREGIVHGDLKPSNLMLKRTGNVKVVDIGSAIDLRTSAGRRFWSPAYAAPEVLAGAENSPQADLASVGYVLIEMLAGRPPFAGLTTRAELLQAKAELGQRLPELLPQEVSCNDLLLHLCRRLTAPDPGRRFPNAEAADLERQGAADFHRQLVKGNLASEYGSDLRGWLEQLE
jgi:eukaryotic-like serine/threonine-protein kinase